MLEEFLKETRNKVLSSKNRNDMGGYTCYKCGNTYPRTPEYWSKNKNKPEGLSYICKQCMREYAQAYRDRTNPNRKKRKRKE